VNRKNRVAGGTPAARGPARNDVVSPDKKQTAYSQGQQSVGARTRRRQRDAAYDDGVKDYGYATDNTRVDAQRRAILIWSPDSKKIATFQQDQRKTGDMYLIETKVGHPTLQAWKYPLPGDPDVTMIERVVIDVPTAKATRLQMLPDRDRSRV